MPQDCVRTTVLKSLLTIGVSNLAFMLLVSSSARATDPLGWLAQSVGFQPHGSIPSQPAYTPLTPMTREGYYWANHLGGGMNSDGYYSRPIPTQNLWGVPLADGVYGSKALWEADVATPTTVRLADGTRYFNPPPNSVRVQTPQGFYYADLTNATTLTFEVREGQVVRQDWVFNRPQPQQKAYRWWEGR
jgi:hypothetical protein